MLFSLLLAEKLKENHGFESNFFYLRQFLSTQNREKKSKDSLK
jgi:hypothetical protein